MAALVCKVCAEIRGQANEVRCRSSNQHNCGLILCSDDFIAYRDPMCAGRFLLRGLRRMDDRHEDHAEDDSEKQSVEAGYKTAHVSSNAGALVRQC